MIDIVDVRKSHRCGGTLVHALRGVTFQIPSNSLAFIAGPSGSGKSTLLHLLGALDEPTSGRITVDGQSLAALSTADRDTFRRETVGFVFQSFNLLANLSALENVLVPFIPRGVTADMKSRATALLTDVGLADRLNHRPAQLSGGEQQRVAIARAVLKQPSVILADEPTGELDSTTGAEIYDYLRTIQSARPTTIVIVTHDLSHVRSSDPVFRIRDGQVDRD